MDFTYDFSSLVQLLVLERFIKTINYISYKIPNLFNEKDKQELIKLIFSKNIKIIPKSIKTKDKINKKVNKYYLKSKVYNKGIITTKKSKCPIEKRCQARIWANAHISIDKNNNIIYGNQCSFKKSALNKYCQKHIKNNKHGNFNEEPSSDIIKEYIHYNPNFKKNIR